MISVAFAPNQELDEPDQELLVIAIAAASIRSLLDQALCADERARLDIELEQVEQGRHALEQRVATAARARRPWWRRLLHL